jgi:hypothetical protein
MQQLRTLPPLPHPGFPVQVLFEANVRLQYSSDERLLLPALQELAGTVAADFPAETLLARPSILVGAATPASALFPALPLHV